MSSMKAPRRDAVSRPSTSQASAIQLRADSAPRAARTPNGTCGQLTLQRGTLQVRNAPLPACRCGNAPPPATCRRQEFVASFLARPQRTSRHAHCFADVHASHHHDRHPRLWRNPQHRERDRKLETGFARAARSHARDRCRRGWIVGGPTDADGDAPSAARLAIAAASAADRAALAGATRRAGRVSRLVEAARVLASARLIPSVPRKWTSARPFHAADVPRLRPCADHRVRAPVCCAAW